MAFWWAHGFGGFNPQLVSFISKDLQCGVAHYGRSSWHGKTAHLMDGTNREGEEEGGFQMSPSKSSPVTGRASTRLSLNGSSPPDTTMLTVINTWTDGEWYSLCALQHIAACVCRLEVFLSQDT